MNLSMIWFAFQLTLVTGISYVMGFLISDWMLSVLQPIGGLWSVISGILVLRGGEIETFHTGLNRILGTVVGCVMGALYLTIGTTIWFFPLAVFVTSLICLHYKPLKNTNISACVTCCVVIIIWYIGAKSNVWLFALSRCVESFFGIITALSIFHIPLLKRT